MATIRSPNRHFDTAEHRGVASSLRSSDGGSFEPDDLHALREENKQLRELVIQLSRLVIRNVVDRK